MKENKIFEFAMKHPIVTLFIASDICAMLTNVVSIVRTGHGPRYQQYTVGNVEAQQPEEASVE